MELHLHPKMEDGGKKGVGNTSILRWKYGKMWMWWWMRMNVSQVVGK